MKKKIIFISLLLVFSSFLFLHKNKSAGATKKDPMDAYGYILTVLYYDGTNTPVAQGKPILVYEDGLLDDVSGQHNKGYYPTNQNDLNNKRYPITQFVDKKNKDTNYYSVPKGEDVHNPYQNDMSNGANNAAQSTDAQTEKGFLNEEEKNFQARKLLEKYGTNNGWKTLNDVINYLSEKVDVGTGTVSLTLQDFANLEAILGNEYVHYEVKSKGINCPMVYGNDPKPTGRAGYIEYILRYMTNDYKVSYPKEFVKLDEYYKTYMETSLGSAKEVVIKYAGSEELIKNYFGITLNPMKMKNYYIQVEAAERVLDTSGKDEVVAGSYICHTITEIKEGYEEGVWEKDSDWKEDEGYGRCADGYDFYEPEWKCKKCTCTSCGADCSITTKHSAYLYGASTGAKCEQGDPIGLDTENGNLYTWSCKKDYWDYGPSPETAYVPKNCNAGMKMVSRFYGSIRFAPSYVKASRTVGGQFISKVKSSCHDSGHDILDENGKPTGKKLYYVGNNLEDAIAGPRTLDSNNTALKNKSYISTLNDAIWDKKNKEYLCTKPNEDGYKSPELGVQYFHFIELPDPRECKRICRKKGDYDSLEFLNCAEQYAEGLIDYDTKGNNRKRKLNLIINACGYTYGTSPTKGNKTERDRESDNSCKNSATEKFKGITYQYNKKSKSSNTNSACNMIDGLLTSNTKGLRASTCSGDQVTDFDNNDRNDDIFDRRTYVNKVCLDSTDFEFKDTSQLNLSKGTGFDYPVIQEGEKVCTYFFNLEQWTVDYASAPARDPEQRKRLNYIIEAFNAEATGASTNKSKYYLDIFKDEGYGKTGFEKKNFDFSEATVSTTIKENLTTNKTDTSSNQSLGIDKKGSNTVRLQVIGQEKVSRVANGTIEKKSIPVNKYISVSEDTVTRSMDKVCISTDGLAKVYDSPGSGVCFEKERNGKTADVVAENKYYTSFQIDENKTNNISASVVVGKDNNYYYKNTENCTYKINNSNSCTLVVEDASDLEKLGNGQYVAKSLNIGIHYQINNSLIKSVSIIDNGKENQIKIGENTLNLNNSGKKSVEVHNLVGKIVLKDGTTKTCKLSVELIQKKSNIGCEIKKINDKLYKITGIGDSIEHYYTYLSGHMTPTADEIRSTGNKPYDFMREVTIGVDQDTRYIRLSKALEAGEVLYGYVTTSDSLVNASCHTPPIRPVPNPVVDDCTKSYKPMKTEEIKNYCAKSWKNDINGYVSSDDCFNKCSTSRVCTNNCSDLQEVTKYCQNAKELGFPGDDAELLCMNKCYCGVKDTNNYLFRSVNVLNPFPNSQESNSPYEKGDRIVGKNWRFLSGYISNDSSDTTTVTGDNANKKVEYVIDLSVADIRSIRNNTNNSEINTSDNKKKVYAKLDRIKTNNSNIVNKYKSQFINSTYASLFKQAHGSIPASFVPGSN